MKPLLKEFFNNFWKQKKIKIIWYSFWRLVAFAQTLFWPFALSRVVNVLTQDPSNWEGALPWIAGMIINKVTEDMIRLRSKSGLENLSLDMTIDFTLFFTSRSEVKEDSRTGEAVQAIKRITEVLNGLLIYYKDNLLQLPVNFIVVPLVLFKTNIDYFILFLVYTFIYLLVDYFAAGFYSDEARDSFEVSEAFWGTAYRKIPDVWREREDGEKLKNTLEKQGEAFYKEASEALNIHYWRWTAVQVLSDLTQGFAVALIVYKIFHGQAEVGDLVLVIGYFQQTQSSLNIVTSANKIFTDLHIALRRLENSVQEKLGQGG